MTFESTKTEKEIFVFLSPLIVVPIASGTFWIYLSAEIVQSMHDVTEQENSGYQ